MNKIQPSWDMSRIKLIEFINSHSKIIKCGCCWILFGTSGINHVIQMLFSWSCMEIRERKQEVSDDMLCILLVVYMTIYMSPELIMKS